MKKVIIVGIILISAVTNAHSQTRIEWAVVQGISTSSLRMEANGEENLFLEHELASMNWGFSLQYETRSWLKLGMQPMLMVKGMEGLLPLLFDRLLTPEVTLRLWTLAIPGYVRIQSPGNSRFRPFLELGPQLDIRLYNQLSDAQRSDSEMIRDVFSEFSLLSIGMWSQLGFHMEIGSRHFDLGLVYNPDITPMRSNSGVKIRSELIMAQIRVGLN